MKVHFWTRHGFIHVGPPIVFRFLISWLIEGQAIISIKSRLPAFSIGKQLEAHRTTLPGNWCSLGSLNTDITSQTIPYLLDFTIDVYNNLNPPPLLPMHAWDPLNVLNCLKMAFLAGVCNKNSAASFGKCCPGQKGIDCTYSSKLKPPTLKGMNGLVFNKSFFITDAASGIYFWKIITNSYELLRRSLYDGNHTLYFCLQYRSTEK